MSDHETIRTALTEVLSAMGVDDAQIQLERPRDPTHGDVASNVAMTLAKKLGRPPRQIAEEIAEKLDRAAAGIDSVDVAGPGFLNFRLAAGAVGSALAGIVEADESWGRSDTGEARPIMVEFVSANPTGPLHIGHARQAALGDAIASLLDWTGWDVHREYYYNDSGRQIELLALSVRARYRQALGFEEVIPDDGYRGQYIVDLAEELKSTEGDRFAKDESDDDLLEIQRFAVRRIREEQDADLTTFRVHFDEYFLESSLYTDGHVDGTIEALRTEDMVYEKDGATWIKSSLFGDQKDRVMVRSNGLPTYFVPDVAYHRNKWGRGFERVINVQGSDHHGTVDRVRAGLQALGLPAGYPEYVLHQMARVVKDGEEVKMSKRTGSGMTLRELCDQVGVEVTRYFFQMRKPDAQMLFDLDVALDQSDKNPMYKVQYAHARMCSIFRKADVDRASIRGGGRSFDALSHELERELIQQLAEFPGVVERAAEHRAPHMVCDYLEQTAGQANSWYHAGNPSRNPELAVLSDDPETREARLALARGVQIVLRNGLRVLGIEAPEQMLRDDSNEEKDG